MNIIHFNDVHFTLGVVVECEDDYTYNHIVYLGENQTNPCIHVNLMLSAVIHYVTVSYCSMPDVIAMLCTGGWKREHAENCWEQFYNSYLHL